MNDGHLEGRAAVPPDMVHVSQSMAPPGCRRKAEAQRRDPW
jgi:hypothetical protein